MLGASDHPTAPVAIPDDKVFMMPMAATVIIAFTVLVGYPYPILRCLLCSRTTEISTSDKRAHPAIKKATESNPVAFSNR